MKQNILPSIALIVGLPQLSETVYTPSLPDITRDLPTCIAMTEYTLTIYLFGFALGILFWGKLSDKTGRKPCILAGLFIFMMGCIGCYSAHSIEMLMLSRLIQAFGGEHWQCVGPSDLRGYLSRASSGNSLCSDAQRVGYFSSVRPDCWRYHCSMFRVGKPFPIFSAICTFFVGTGGQIFARNPFSKPATIYCIRHDYPSLTQR